MKKTSEKNKLPPLPPASPAKLPPLQKLPPVSPAKLPSLQKLPPASPVKLPPLPISPAKLPPLTKSVLPPVSPAKLPPLTKSVLPPVSPAKLPPLTKSVLPPVSPLKTLPPLKSLSKLPPLKSTEPLKSPKKLGQTLTKVRDVDLKILMELNDRDLLSFCNVDTYANDLCRNEDFWRNRFLKVFGAKAAKYKTANRTWRNHYLKVVSHLDAFSFAPWSFFKILSWNIGDEDTVRYEGKKISESPENVMNAYWMLNLGKEVTLDLPQDRYSEMDNKRKTFKSDTYLTPAQIVKAIEKFYEEPLTRKELKKMQEEDVEGADEWNLKNADMKMVSRGDILGNVFFEGFKDIDSVLEMQFGS